MSVALSEEMAASARQPQSMQPGVSGQSSTVRSEGGKRILFI